jgi:hypothetical protein
MKLALIAKNVGPREIERIFQLTFVAADNYVTGGVTLDFTAAVNSAYADRPRIPALISGGTPPPASRFHMLQEPDGYSGEVLLAAASPTLKNYLFKITSTANTELNAAGVVAGVYNDVNGFTFSCVTPKKYG